MTERSHVDGRKFIEWLYEQRPDLEGNASSWLTGNQARAMGRWKQEGSRPDVTDIPDQICVRLGLSIEDIPDHVWVAPKVGGRKSLPWGQRRARQLLAEGFYKAEIARMLDVSPGTVHRWLRDEEQEAA